MALNPEFSRIAAGVLNGPYFSYARFTEKDGIKALDELDAERNMLTDALHDDKTTDYESLSDEARKVYDKAYEMWKWAGHCVPRDDETPEEYDLRDRMEGPVFFQAKDADADLEEA